MSNSSPLHWLQNARFLCSPLFPEVCSNSCPLSWWHYLNISSSSTHFSSYPQSFPVPGTFPMSWLFTSDGQGIGASASASVLPMNIQGWFPLGLSGSISLKSKGLSRVFSNTTMWEHQFFGIQSSSYSNSHIHTWLLEKKKKKNMALIIQIFARKMISLLIMVEILYEDGTEPQICMEVCSQISMLVS